MGKLDFQEMWIIEILVGLAVLFAAFGAIKALLGFLQKKIFNRLPTWRKKIDWIVLSPMQALFIIFGCSFILDVLSHRFDFVSFFHQVVPFRNALLVLCMSWTLLRWKNEAEKQRFGNTMIDPNMARMMSKFFTAIIFVITALLVLQALGINILPLMAFGSIGAAAVAFAGKDVITNWFGGFLLFIQRPFTIGDTILFLDKNIEGVVEEIGWYTTAVRDKDKRPMFIPNMFFSTMFVINLSRMTHRRILETIRLRFEDISVIPSLTQKIRFALQSLPTIDAGSPMVVSFQSFGEYALELIVDVYTFEIDYEKYCAVKQEVLMLIHKIIVEEKAALAVNSLTLAVPPGTSLSQPS